ncbi:MAG: acyl-CoA thioester hydrolase/BAAT C-terminal domain-containing protein [Candidatus Izemoplasmatales bacterium]|nr:acyl-CoA thioester hydrolase/BAAT C-terminal domain-containing protein [Candidatus Izemoplasmatales bacterium]
MNNINKESLKYESITFNLLYKNTPKDKPIVFFFHGFGGDKEYGAGGKDITLASMGYTVIVLDAYEHGERRTNEYKELDNSQRQAMIIDTEINTAHDAIKVYDFLVEDSKISSEMPLAVYGVSMGAAIAFYLSTIFDKVKSVVSIVGSPSFVDFYSYKQEVYSFPKDNQFYDRLKKYQRLDPLLNYKLFENKKVFMSVGLRDKIVPMIYAKKLSSLIECEYREYDLGHESNPEMLSDSYNFLDKSINH